MRSMRRILIVGSSDPKDLEVTYARSLEDLGTESVVFDPTAIQRPLHASRVLNRLTAPLQHLAVARQVSHRFEYADRFDAVLVFKGHRIPAGTIRYWRERTRVPCLNLNPDSPFDPGPATSSRHIRAAIRHYDAYVTFSTALLPRLAQGHPASSFVMTYARDGDGGLTPE